MSILPPSAQRFLASVRTQPAEYQHVVRSRLEMIEDVLKGTRTVRVGEEVHTDWWRLKQVASALKEDAARTGFREAVKLFDRLCQMADQALLGLVSVDLVAEQVAV